MILIHCSSLALSPTSIGLGETAHPLSNLTGRSLRALTLPVREPNVLTSFLTLAWVLRITPNLRGGPGRGGPRIGTGLDR